MNEAKEKTALCTSVGADERQSVQNTISSISALDTEINHPDENSPENFEDILRQMQRMSDPAYLHTVSMNELYETVYQSRPPVIDGLLYSGTYLFAGAPKVGKSFFMAQLAYHISTGQPLWNYEVHQGTVLYLALEDDYQRLQERMSLIQELRADKRFAQFSEYGIINVGITTGNNGYFSITEETSEQYQLSEVTLPLIGRSSHVHGIYFTAQDWEKNKIAGKRARLISFPEIPYDEYPAKHKEYISLGEANGEHEGYKCSIRERWYIVPSVWVPDAFFLRRNNFYPKFVLNKCDAVSTDTMHRMKFNDGVDPENVLLAYYNSISFAFTEICGRSYGGGVLEILPGEMGNILLPKVERIDPALRDKLLAHIDAIVRNDEDIELALDVVDKELLVDTLGIDPEICRKCRAIWKKMQTRRLGRG